MHKNFPFFVHFVNRQIKKFLVYYTRNQEREELLKNKKIFKKNKKTLDNQENLWYNKYVIKRENKTSSD